MRTELIFSGPRPGLPAFGRLAILLLGLAAFTSGPSGTELGNKLEPETVHRTPGDAGVRDVSSLVRPGIVVVRFTDRVQYGKRMRTTGLTSVDKRLALYDVSSILPALPTPVAQKRGLRTSALDGVYFVRFNASRAPEDLASELAGLPEVEYAEPLYVHRTAIEPNDQSFGNMDQFNRVLAPQAWDVVKTEGSVVIAVVDGGTDWRHEDLMANIWINPGEIPENGIDDDENGFIDDVHGWNFAGDKPDPTGLPNTQQNHNHGTHVSGTAAAVTDNGVGVASLSWNATLMAVNGGSSNTDDEITYGYDGIVYAASNGADVINCSWGRPGGLSRFEEDTIEYAFDNGAIVVAAAGNQTANVDDTPHYPASYARVLSVGATSSNNDGVAGFSNYGVGVDVFAPGVAILSTVPNGGYSGFFSGTSMASPMAAGLAALVKTARPLYSPDEIREQIRMTSDPIDADNPGREGMLGRGRINAFRAVTEFDHPSIRISEAFLATSDADGMISPGETVDVTVRFKGYLNASPILQATLSTPEPFAVPTVSEAFVPAVQPGDETDVTFTIAVTTDVPIHHEMVFYVDLEGADYTDRAVFTILANPSRAENIGTGAVQTSVTTEGNIGALGFYGQTDGIGFVHDGNNYLFEGGLLVATDALHVSDSIREKDSIQEQDFRPAYGSDLVFTAPGSFASTESSLTLVDSLASRPLGLSIRQDTYADDAAENEDFVTFVYTITNDSDEQIDNLHVGLFFDWDVSDNAMDNAGFDEDRQMGYINERVDQGEPDKFVATLLLTSLADLSYRLVVNGEDLFDDAGFTSQEKFEFMSGGVVYAPADGRDLSQMTAQGPLSVRPGGTVEVAFAVIGAANLAELQTSADQALIYFDSLPVDTEPEVPDFGDRPRLGALFPNPFVESTTLSFSLPAPDHVEITVFDLLGRRVAQLVNRQLPAGSHAVVWHGDADVGYRAAPGVYFIRLSASGMRITQPVTHSR